jgi:hypothetical protein
MSASSLHSISALLLKDATTMNHPVQIQASARIKISIKAIWKSLESVRTTRAMMNVFRTRIASTTLKKTQVS